MVHMLDKGSSDYPCVVCGSPGTVIRSTPDPRLKCSQCGFLYDGSESARMQKEGQIPDAAPELQDPNPPTTDINRQAVPQNTGPEASLTATSGSNIPRTPAFVFVSKDRTLHEFCSKRDLQKVALRWQISDKTYEVFELQAKKVSANVSIT